MFKKHLIAAILVIAAALGAYAGFDQYTGKTFTTLLSPVVLGTYLGTESTTATVYSATIKTTATNSNYTGVDCVGLVGRGAVVIGLNTSTGVVSVSFATCATTNGTYVTMTNDQGESSWAVTNGSAHKVIPVRPNAFSRYWRTTATATGNTNATADAVLITE